ncbi:MAG: glutamate synthase small subunit [Planctomycetaceae bacterium]|nr:glutamate synthase small subunit [Planctomycetaceae bacterium]
MKVDPRYLTSQGPQVFTGAEMLLKGALEADGGVHLLGGYPGSPVAGFFDSMALIKDLLNDNGIRAVINHNEALAAAMLNGTQLLPARAIICMKSVGVHVAADALALGNMSGANPAGGAIVIYGDDPWSDSTQVAADSRYISRHLYIPTIEPATHQEIKDWVNLSFKLSARSELFAGFVLTTNLADGGGTVECKPNQYPVTNMLNPVELETARIDLDKRVLLPPKTWWQEATFADRFTRAQAAARDLKLNRLDYPSDTRKPVGFVATGLAYSYLVQSLWEMDLLGEFPILKFGLSYPIDPAMVHLMAEQAQRIVVIEERRGFMEEQIGQIILRDRQSGQLPADLELWGKKFPAPLQGIPDTRGLHPSIITDRLVALLRSLGGGKTTVVFPPAAAEAIDREAATLASTAQAQTPTIPGRTPTFCPGCPHRDSASLCLEIKQRFADKAYMARKYKRGPIDMVFHGDIGCYTMLMFPPNTDLMHNLSGMGLGGGTGSGADPFITNKQAVFMGDSTFFHCGALGISQAIKLGQDITFVILDNSTTAMTGHQTTPGLDFDVLGNPTPVQDIEDVVRGLAARTDMLVARVDPEKRDEYGELLERTFLDEGVKVLIATKECGITRIRRQRRLQRQTRKELGYLPAWQHMNVNTDVCRFCLACAELTGCPGLRHVQTDYGPKIDTDITACVDDGACQRIGACWSFERVMIHRRKAPRTRVPELNLDDIPEPEKRVVGDLWRCCLAGVGGQGVGLSTQILVRAAHKEGYPVLFLDKKGLAIRNGGVTSQIVYNVTGQPVTAVIPFGKADLLIGVDALEAVRMLEPHGRMRAASKDQTAAVVNTHKVPTVSGLMGREDYDVEQMERTLRECTRDDDFMARDISRICEEYLGSKLFANIMMLGFAFQKGLIPVSMHSMAWAIKDTIKTDIRRNLYAFNMGRKLVEQPDLFQGPPVRDDWSSKLEECCRNTIRRYRGGQQLADEFRAVAAAVLTAGADLGETIKRDFVIRLYDTMRWGGIEYARRYADAVLTTYRRDSAARHFAATAAVVHNLAAAMLVKDAFFIAELSTSPEKYARDRRKYNVNPANGDWIEYVHLLPMKLKLGPWQWHWCSAMGDRGMRWLRGLKFLRKLLPWRHRTRKQFLAKYEAAVAAFRSESEEDYRRGLEALAGRQCMDCLIPRCRDAGCPLEAPVPVWLNLAYEGKWSAAAEALHEANNFPEFTSRICPAPCQSACKQSHSGGPVPVRSIERQVIDKAFENGWVKPRKLAAPTGKKVAIVGSGPAGLAAAQQLARKGHAVTVFERDDAPGGLLRYGIPDWRLDKALIDRRVDQLREEGVSFRTFVQVGHDLPANALRDDFDAICLAAGAARPRDLRVPGRDHTGIHFAWDFLAQQNRRSAGVAVESAAAIDAKGKVVLVIGGGETGSDCAETALAQGAVAVHQFEILSPAQVRRDPLHEGPAQVTRHWCTTTKAINANGQSGLEIVANEVRWVQSAAGRQMVDVAGSEFVLRADIILLALGYEAICDGAIVSQLNLAVDPRGRLVVNDFAASAPGVFVAGDLASGPSLVASAIDSGRQAAKTIDVYLQNLKKN